MSDLIGSSPGCRGDRADLYRARVIFYEILTGNRPSLTDAPIALVQKHAYDPVPPLPAEHARYQEIIDCLLVKSPATAVLTLPSSVTTSPTLRREAANRVSYHFRDYYWKYGGSNHYPDR